MQSIEVFSVRDLRLRSSELVRDAEAGQVSIGCRSRIERFEGFGEVL